jgi:hypothetical protein
VLKGSFFEDVKKGAETFLEYVFFELMGMPQKNIRAMLGICKDTATKYRQDMQEVRNLNQLPS